MRWTIVFMMALSYGAVNAQRSTYYGRRRSGRSEQYTVELLLVVDYSAYVKWYDKMPDTSPTQKKRATITAIWEHYSSVIHGIDAIYRGLEENGLRISVKPVDIQVISTSGIVTSGSETVTSDTALNEFYQWTRKQTTLPKFDHAVLITGYDLMEHGDKSKSGRAYLGTMCSIRSLSIVENDFSFEVVHITAHELAHSFNCGHDGNNNGCHENDGYLMASIIEINSTNRWYFSPCSEEYIWDLLTSLDMNGQMCLTTQDSDSVGMNTVAMGELYTPDQQCALIETPGSYLCRSFYKTSSEYSTLCSNIWCHGTTDKEDVCNNYEGSDGFLCGDMKVCEKGRCIFKNTAVEARDDCPLGDQPGIVWNNQTCVQMVYNEPEMCYDENTRLRCCFSCEEIKQKHNTGCEYGDKSSWCRTDMIVPTGCYKNAELCCRTCKLAIDVKKPTCPYGDKSLWCKTKLQAPYDCYMNEELCCGTCEKYVNPKNVGCEYGDRSAWCKNSLAPPYGCYKNAELCCGTCPKHYHPEFPGCEYGDRSKWCQTDLVQPSGCYFNTEFCCKTCKSYLNSSNVGCEYGDKSKDCLTLNYPAACYNNDDTCCGSCGKHKDPSQPGCEYGDKSSWCTTKLDPVNDCPLNLDLCCGTCAMDGSGISERQVYVYGRQLFTHYRRG